MPAADICFTFLGSGQSLPGVAEWHSLLSICKCCNRSSPGQLAVLCARVTCPVFEPADQRGSRISGSTTLRILGHAHNSPAPWEEADFFPAAPILSLLPSTSNLKLLRHFFSQLHEWQGSSSAALYPKTQLNCPWKNFMLQRPYFLCSLGGAKSTTHWELLVKKKNQLQSSGHA